MAGYEIGRLATTNDVASGFSTSAMMSDLNDIVLGQANIQQTLCQGFSGINATVNQRVCELGYQVQNGFNGVQRQISDCCCNLITNQNNNTQRIIDYLNCEKISALQAENSALKGQLSQNAQTNTIINTLRPVAQPAYITCSPYETAFGFTKNNCGCC